jgi:hypothetical protein
VYYGIYAGAVLSATGVGAIGGVPLMMSGVVGLGYAEENIVASFSNVPGAAGAVNHPSNLGGLGGRVVGGERGQLVGGTMEDIIGARGAKSAFEKISSGISLVSDGYDAGSIAAEAFNNLPSSYIVAAYGGAGGGTPYGGYYDLATGNLIREDRVTVQGSMVEISSTANWYGGRAGLVGGGSAWPGINGSAAAYTYNPLRFPQGYAPWGYGQGIGWGNAGGWNAGLASIDARNQGLAFASNNWMEGFHPPGPP